MADPPHNMPSRPCSFCDGIGTMRTEKGYRARSRDEDEFTELVAIVGEKCPMCFGRGETYVLGEAPRRLNS